MLFLVNTGAVEAKGDLEYFSVAALLAFLCFITRISPIINSTAVIKTIMLS